MEETTTQPPSIANHPYMQGLQHRLETHKKLLQHLEMRMKLSPQAKSDYEKNEHQITLIRTKGEISAIKRVISEVEQYFIKYMQQFIIDQEDCETNWNTVIDRAKASENSIVKEILIKVKWENIDVDIEAKISLFKSLKEKTS